MTMRLLIRIDSEFDKSLKGEPVFLHVNNILLKGDDGLDRGIVLSYGKQDFGWTVSVEELEKLVELAKVVRQYPHLVC